MSVAGYNRPCKIQAQMPFLRLLAGAPPPCSPPTIPARPRPTGPPLCHIISLTPLVPRPFPLPTPSLFPGPPVIPARPVPPRRTLTPILIPTPTTPAPPRLSLAGTFATAVVTVAAARHHHHHAAAAAGLGVLHLAVPGGQARGGAAQPAAQLVQEQARVRPPQEVGQQRLGVPRPRAALDVDRLEDRDDVLEQELGVVGAPLSLPLLLLLLLLLIVVAAGAGCFCFCFCFCFWIWVGEKAKDLQLAPDPEAGPRDEVWCRRELGRCWRLAVLGDAVGTDVCGAG